MARPPALVVEDYSFWFRVPMDDEAEPALEHISFEIEQGEFVLVLGRSGSGKSTLALNLVGIYPDYFGGQNKGKISIAHPERGLINRREVEPGERFQLVNMLFQNPQDQIVTLSVEEEVAFALENYLMAPSDIHPRIDWALDLVGLTGFRERSTMKLSGGEKQRVALGRALLANPRLLLMDEPLAALDQPRKEEILPFIEQLKAELDLPVVYVSHAMQEILRLADTLVLMSNGRIEAVGPLEALTSRLDLRPLTGRYEAGAVLGTTVAGQDKMFGLTELRFAGGRLKVPHLSLPLGQALRVRIRARDVSIALTPPADISILNIIPCIVKEIGEEKGPQVDLQLDAGGAPIWARITARSCAALKLRPGLQVYALVKSVAIDRQSLGRRDAATRFLAEED